MSSRAGKLEKNVLKASMPVQKTKSVVVRLNVKLDNIERSVIIEIAGVPQDLPQELEPTVIRTAEQQFCAAVNNHTFIDTYDIGVSPKDCKPTLYNLKKFGEIKILSTEKIDEFNND
jgi:hypothetical protein